MRIVRNVMVVAAVAVVSTALPLVAGAGADPSAVPATEPVAQPASVNFTDVPPTASFAQGVGWMVDEGITGGFGGSGRFSPSVQLNRAQMALFLWRLMGEPVPEASPCGFTDMVGRDQEQIDATCWLKERGVTTGINLEGTLYGPTGPVPRGQMGAFMSRLAGESSETASCGFTDAPRNEEFAQAACWLKENGITTGTNPAGTLFSPSGIVTRGQVAAFLFRLAAATDAWNPTRLTPEVATCEVIDPATCMLPFPSDTFTEPTRDTDTGLRLDFPATATPANNKGKRIDPTDINRNDGFSPGSVLLTYLPGVDLEASGAAPITDMQKSLDPETPVLLVNAETGDLHPHWVEYDAHATTEADSLLTIVPARNFEEGTRYLVALRNLTAEGGGAIEAGAEFAALRDGTPTEFPMVEARRERMNALLEEFTQINPTWDPQDFVLAWDFTVASERNLSERILHMRDEALGPLSNPAPSFTATRTRSTENNVTRNIIDGTITVPNYQSNTTVVPLRGGAPFNWGPDGLPERNTVLRNLSVPYRCVMPNDTVVNDPAKGLTEVSMYGHGLLGAYTEVSAGHVKDFADEHDVMFCAVSWHGFSSNDLGNAYGALQDLSTFSAIADGGQQGLLHQMFLGRLLRHPSGFRTNAAFRSGNTANGTILLDNTQVGYDGNSQGGIMGGALLAVSPDVDRGVLGVPGMNYSVLLYRSSDWSGYADIFNPAYPREIDRLQALGLAQIMWDRIEVNGYAHHLDPNDPLPNTLAKRAMLHVAWADHQVAVVTADNLARTAQIPLYNPPALATGRASLWNTPGLGDNPDEDPFWGIPRIANPQDGLALGLGAYVMWDSGNTPAPLRNVPPGAAEFWETDVKPDPHERPRRAPGSRQQKYDFMFGGTLTNCPSWDIDGNPATGTGGKEQILCLAPNPGVSYPWLPAG